jgi:hypothetical protein
VRIDANPQHAQFHSPNAAEGGTRVRRSHTTTELCVCARVPVDRGDVQRVVTANRILSQTINYNPLVVTGVAGARRSSLCGRERRHVQIFRIPSNSHKWLTRGAHRALSWHFSKTRDFFVVDSRPSTAVECSVIAPVNSPAKTGQACVFRSSRLGWSILDAFSPQPVHENPPSHTTVLCRVAPSGRTPFRLLGGATQLF